MSNSRILIGLLTAHHPSRAPYRARARETFLRGSPLDWVWVYGRGALTENDGHSLIADCPDEKEWMVEKNRALFKYALAAGYDFCFRACDDTWVYPERLMAAGLEPYDYAGHMPCKFNLGGTFKIWMKYFDYMHGGCGIWLSRKAMEILVGAPWDGPELKGWPEQVDVGFDLKVPYSQIDWDDRWIGEALKGFPAWDDPIRNNPIDGYARMGLNVFEDDQLFVNDDPMRALSIHDPGVLRAESEIHRAMREKIKQRGGVVYA